MRSSLKTHTTNLAFAAAVIASVMPTSNTLGGTGGAGGYSGGIAEREIVRRQERIARASEEEAAGDTAYADEDYEAAVNHYKTALDLLPLASVAEAARERVIVKYSDSAVRRAQQRATRGEYDAARALLTSVQSYDPDNRGAKKLLEQLDDPEWYNPANSPEHSQRVQEVQKNLQLAQGYYDLGDFDKARDTYNKVLATDRYNTAARRALEKTEKKISQYLLSARDHTRAKMLREVDELWETPVPSAINFNTNISGSQGSGVESTSVVNNKLDKIIIPSIQLEGSSIDEAVEFLRIKSRELDITSTDPTDRGVNIILNLGAARPSKINLNLSQVPLRVAIKEISAMAGLRYRVESYAVIISSSDDGSSMYTRTYRVPPQLFPYVESPDTAASNDIFGGGATASGGSGINRVRVAAKDVLQNAGIPFPESASAFYNSSTSTLTVRNTATNLDLVQDFIDNNVSVQKMINITTKFVEVKQTNTEEFGFDWLLGGFDVSRGGTFATGGTAGNRTAGPVGTAAWPLVAPGQATPVGGSNLLTGGLRFGNNAIKSDAIDGLLNAGGNIEGVAESSVSPAIFGIGGVYTDAQFQTVLRALNQKKGADLLTAPSITARSGQKAKIEVIREFIYPTEFEPPEIPQNFGGNTTGGSFGGLFGGGGGAANGAFPVTPTTPTTFDTKNTGVTLEVEPTLAPDNYTVDLSLAPQVVEFEGFINYGSPIQTSGSDSLGNPVTIILTENRIEQPVFSKRSLSTAVSVYDGMTLGVGGLIREDVQSVEDKVPIFGDIPYVGRLFRTKADQFFKRNLMMFVTVKLITPDGQPANTSSLTPSSTLPSDASTIGGPATPLLPPIQ